MRAHSHVRLYATFSPFAALAVDRKFPLNRLDPVSAPEAPLSRHAVIMPPPPPPCGRKLRAEVRRRRFAIQAVSSSDLRFRFDGGRGYRPGSSQPTLSLRARSNDLDFGFGSSADRHRRTIGARRQRSSRCRGGDARNWGASLRAAIRTDRLPACIRVDALRARGRACWTAAEQLTQDGVGRRNRSNPQRAGLREVA